MVFLGHKAVYAPKAAGTDALSAWHSYVCGHCGQQTSGAVVAVYPVNAAGVMEMHPVLWLCCTACGMGSVKNGTSAVVPSVPFGPSIQGLPQDVKTAYSEARQCLGANAPTAAELMCRKILMHIAVDKGARERDTFKHYIEFLENAGYVTPPMKRWVELIKDNGNESNHLLAAPDRKRAESTVMFTAELLRLVYEMEYLANLHAPPP